MLLHLHSTQSDQRRTDTITGKIKAPNQMHVPVTTLAKKINVITRYLKEVPRAPFYWDPWWWPRTPEKCICSLSLSLSTFRHACPGVWKYFQTGLRIRIRINLSCWIRIQEGKIIQIRIRFNLDRWTHKMYLLSLSLSTFRHAWPGVQKYFQIGLRIRIRINLDRWILIRIREGKNDFKKLNK
jgi:hypothetical protein